MCCQRKTCFPTFACARQPKQQVLLQVSKRSYFHRSKDIDLWHRDDYLGVRRATSTNDRRAIARKRNQKSESQGDDRLTRFVCGSVLFACLDRHGKQCLYALAQCAMSSARRDQVRSSLAGGACAQSVWNEADVVTQLFDATDTTRPGAIPWFTLVDQHSTCKTHLEASRAYISIRRWISI